MKFAYFSFIVFCFFISPAWSFDDYALVKNKVTIRIDSTITSHALGYLDKGEKVKIIKEQFNWCKVVLPQKFPCYISSKFVQLINPGEVRVIPSTLNIRSNPALDSVTIGTVKKGIILPVIANLGLWFQINGYPYASGWIHMQFVRKIQEEHQIEKKRFTTKSIPLNFQISENKSVLLNQSVHSVDIIDDLIGALSDSDMQRKEQIHRKLIEMGMSIIPKLENYLLADKNTVESICLILIHFGHQKPELALDFLMKIDPNKTIQSALYLDVISEILQIQENHTSYLFIVQNNKLTARDIKRAKINFLDVYNKKINVLCQSVKKSR